MRRVPYVWALAVATCLTSAAEYVAPVTPELPVGALLTLLVAQVPLPARREPEQPLTARPRRSELDRHLERRARRGEAD